MEEENLTEQVNEVEALAAIYEDAWSVVDEAQRSYNVKVAPEGHSEKSIDLQIQMGSNYPSNAPPVYQLNAPWLRGQDRAELSNKLEQIYLEHAGESIIYMWAEAIREYLNELAQNDLGDEMGEEEQEIPDITHYAYKHSSSPRQQQHTGVELPEIFHGEILTDRKSVFQAHLAPVHSVEQVEMVMKKLLENRKIMLATHNILAYRIMPEGKRGCVADCKDDGEFGASNRMLHLMEIVHAENVMVVVTRWYGGVHLGPDRFKHINSLTRQMLENHNYIAEKADKKGPQSKGKKKAK